MADQSLYGDVTFTLNSYTPTLKVTVTGHQSYSGITGHDPWNLKVFIDDMSNPVNTTGGSGIGTETPILVAVKRGLSAGNHVLRVTWSGSQYITFNSDSTTVETFFK